MDNFENRTPESEPENKPDKQEKAQGAPKTEPQKVYYRPSQQYQQNQYQQQNQQQYQQYQDQRYVPQGAYQQAAQKSGMPTWLKVLIAVALVLILLIYMMSSCISSIGKTFNSTIESGLMDTGVDVTTADATGEYVGIIHVEGTISEDSANSGYNHKYILRSIDDMIKDDNNKGIILYLDTPGGTVYASDEVYFAIKEYQEKTGRPVYASMQSMAASGGYYISAPCDKIFANRNCWTGSIGVTMGSYLDLTGLLDKLGIKVNTITSGRNKSMGSSYEEMTDEQKEIFQSLIDEAYDQFTGIVADGRKMNIKDVKELADGRVYTALQAKENGLIDEIGTYEECVEAMKKDYSLGADIELLDFISSDSTDLMSYLGLISEDMDMNAGVLTAEEIQKLLDINGTLRMMYIYG